MSNLTKFQATYFTNKRIVGRGFLQIVLEVPIERELEVLNFIGPQRPGEDTWLEVTRVEPQE